MISYSRISELTTDEFWILATVALRNSSYCWSAPDIVTVLQTAGYYTEAEEPFSNALVKTVLKKMIEQGWIVELSYTTSFEMPAKAIRLIRQYLLAKFSKEATVLATALLKKYSNKGSRYHSYDRPAHGEKKLWGAFKGKAGVVFDLLKEVYPEEDDEDYDEGENDEYYVFLQCGVYGNMNEAAEAALVFLPPYPEGFLTEIPSAILSQILIVFSQRPYLFRREAYAELWKLIDLRFATNPQLVARAAINFLPNLPPGAEPELWERLPDLAVVAGWASGKTVPADDDAASFDPNPALPTVGWHLRAVAQLNAGKVTRKALTPAFSRLKRLPPAAINLLLKPGSLSEKKYLESLSDEGVYGIVILLLTLTWTGSEVSNLTIYSHNWGAETINAPELKWLKIQLSRLLKENEINYEDYGELVKDSATENDFRYFEDLMLPPSEWEIFLNSLEGLKDKSVRDTTRAVEGDKRLVYVYEETKESLIVREQRMGKKGWTPGRKIEWSQFSILAKHPRDQVIEPALRNYNNDPIIRTRHSYWDNQVYKVDVPHALYLLASHPYVYEDDRKRQPLSIEKAEAQLLVDHDEAGNLELRLDPPELKEGYSIRRAGPGKLVVYEVSKKLMETVKHIPKTGIKLPATAVERFERLLPDLRNKLEVHSSTDWMGQDLPEVNGQPLPCFHLVPLGDHEHRVEIFIKPLPEGTLYFRPKEGLSRSLMATETEGRAVLVRDLDAEEKAVDSCLDNCPSLQALEFEGYDTILTTTQQTLNVLQELQALAQVGHALIEYPKGQRLRLGEKIDDDQLQVTVSSGRDWFRVEAGLQLDEERVIDFELILEGLRNKDKFVRIGEDEYLMLTQGLQDRLNKMDGLLHQNRGTLELAPLAGAAFAEALEGLEQVKADKAWEENLERMARADRFTPPPPPPAFKADLRDYQKTGYEWLLRLAEWGVGACLADDMGLGKTIQALAVLTERFDGGPALVIAPASVIRNWRTETARFAPTLTPKLIASASEAEDLLKKISPGDVVLLSFGLLTYISEALLATQFHTLVVDEAQAIKNPATQRSRLVRDLQADWKLATTGTPIENNLAELWSLFRFLNPGLFGSYARFRTQYETPIVKHQDEKRAEQLRRVVRPFILRRRKEDVLTELPPKTEIVRTVESGPEEKSLYEALRRKALRDIDSADQQRRRFIVLQQLTQLRQAACHPKLLNKKSKVPSAKLEAVGETIQEILDGGHKALVFSQFVGHLKLVEQWVIKEKIPYQYLDGSTPGKTRQQRVEAFQEGDGKLFLISLKAGGTGLNLTEADYVLHLDPWWNPAVEDQASDRAHRMGQQKPVTVYRFVSAGTIEEQILELHASKRDLADRLLAGTDGAGSLSVDDVVELLRQT